MKIIPFYTALQKADRTIIDNEITEEEFEDLLIDFMEMDKSKKTPIEQQRELLKNKISFIAVALFYLEEHSFDEDIANALGNYDIKITNDYFFQDMKIAEQKLSKLQKKYKLLNESKPKKLESKEKSDIYDILTSMSASLELHLNFESMTVKEFISWNKVLDSKISQLKSIKDGRK